MFKSQKATIPDMWRRGPKEVEERVKRDMFTPKRIRLKVS